jgi:hypothetical protein
MDFVRGLLRTQSGYDALWVIADRLTKVARFRHIKTTYTRLQLAKLYMPRIVYFHGVPRRIVSDRETQISPKFGEKLHETLDTYWNFSSAYHP